MLECIESYAYRLNTSPGIDNVFYTWLLRPAADNLFLSQCRADWQPPVLIANDDGEEYEIEAILNKHVINRGRDHHHKYWIKWTGYARPMWESASIMEDTAALDVFKRRRNAGESLPLSPRPEKGGPEERGNIRK